MRTKYFLAAAAALLFALAATATAYLNLRGEDSLEEEQRRAATPEQVERGRYLALAGNCAGCHTDRGGAAYAGGAGIVTQFGTVFPGNLTPDPETGLGGWSSGHFWRALHDGRSSDGRLLYPAFPYPSYTHVSRDDSDAIFHYLQSLAPVKQANRPHELRFPYDSQAALAIWRALFFEPGGYVVQPDESAQWNRGAYLVEGLGHCIACHGPRNALGATIDERGLSGALMPMQNWYAPSLTSASEASVADWELQHIVDLLGTGKSSLGSTIGPMADVVYSSTQHLADADLRAIAAYLKSVPQQQGHRAIRETSSRDPQALVRGGEVYEAQCAQCHGNSGEGTTGEGAMALAGNRAVTLESPVNLIRMVREGGFLPATQGNPRPHGMPPFGHVLDDGQIADVLTFIRGSWGNDAAPVQRLQTSRH